MSVDRAEGRRANHRALRPTLEGRLETRSLMSHVPAVPGPVYLANPRLGFAFAHNNPPFTTDHAPHFKARFPLTPHVGEQTAHGGQSAKIYVNGGAWMVTLSEYTPAISAGGTNSQSATGTGGVLYAPPYQVPGTVRAYPMAGGKFGLIVDGSTALTELDVNPVAFPQRKGYAHSFAYAYAGRPRVLDIGSINVTSGQIGAIQGFHSADLSGPLTINGANPGIVDRIAFDAITPGASISTGGTVNTIDVAKGITLNDGGSIVIGRDLNLLNVGQDVNLFNGSSIIVGRTLGALPQPAKGTGTGAGVLGVNQSVVGTTSTVSVPNVAAYIQGDLNIGPGSALTVGTGIGQPFVATNLTTAQSANIVVDIQGNVTGASRIHIPKASLATTANPGGNIIVNGTITP